MLHIGPFRYSASDGTQLWISARCATIAIAMCGKFGCLPSSTAMIQNEITDKNNASVYAGSKRRARRFAKRALSNGASRRCATGSPRQYPEITINAETAKWPNCNHGNVYGKSTVNVAPACETPYCQI